MFTVYSINLLIVSVFGCVDLDFFGNIIRPQKAVFWNYLGMRLTINNIYCLCPQDIFILNLLCCCRIFNCIFFLSFRTVSFILARNNLLFQQSVIRRIFYSLAEIVWCADLQVFVVSQICAIRWQNRTLVVSR